METITQGRVAQKKQQFKITQETLVPISLVISAVGFISWLTMLYWQTQTHGVAIADIKTEQTETVKKIDKILFKLGVIEGLIRK